jgi:hypothetical protein
MLSFSELTLSWVTLLAYALLVSPKTRSLLLTVVVLGLIVGAWAIWYVSYKPHRDVSAEKPSYTLTSQAFSDAFKSDTAAYKTYADKAILVEGPVTALEGAMFLLAILFAAWILPVCPNWQP